MAQAQRSPIFQRSLAEELAAAQNEYNPEDRPDMIEEQSDYQSASRTAAETGDDLQALMSDAFKKTEDFIKANPIPVAIGVAATGALIALALTSRKPTERDWMRAMKRQTDDIARTVKSEARRLSNTDTAETLSRMLSHADVQKTVQPWVNQLFDLVTTARDRTNAAVRSATK